MAVVNDVERTAAERTEDGASAVEYGLLVAGIAGLVVLIVFAFGGAIGELFSDSCGEVGGYITGGTCT